LTRKKRKRIGQIVKERKPPIPLPKRTKSKREKIDANENKHKRRDWE